MHVLLQRPKLINSQYSKILLLHLHIEPWLPPRSLHSSAIKAKWKSPLFQLPTFIWLLKLVNHFLGGQWESRRYWTHFRRWSKKSRSRRQQNWRFKKRRSKIRTKIGRWSPDKNKKSWWVFGGCFELQTYLVFLGLFQGYNKGQKKMVSVLNIT